MSKTAWKLKLRPLRREDLYPIVANLIPVFGVAFWGWSPTDAFIVYALETLIVGAMNVIKMLLVTFVRSRHEWENKDGSVQLMPGLFFIFFFIVHYGMFAGIQTSIFAGVSRIGSSSDNPFSFFFHWYKYVKGDVVYMLSGFIVSYVGNNLAPFIASGEYKTISMTRLMMQPYGRIIVQQFTVILGSMLLALNLGIGFIIVFVPTKLYFELFLNFDTYIDNTMKEAAKMREPKKP